MAGRHHPLTILIVARDAAATIERAIRSCLPEEGCPILLADDHSTDDTIDRAALAGGRRLRIVQTPDPGGVAAARQRALEETDTAFAAWLDADDEWIPGRASRLSEVLSAGSDVAIDTLDLYDGPSGAWLRRLVVPGFMRETHHFVRLFERNTLPGDTQVAFRTRVFREAGGYDPSLCGPESYDLLLRVMRRGGRFSAIDEVGYRMYAYPDSVSRNLPRQRAALAASLRKHAYEDIRRLYLSAGYPDRIAAWALVVIAQYRDEPAAAIQYLDEACPPGSDSHEVLEPEGPWPFAEGWRRAFHMGTILLSLGDRNDAALDCLRQAESIRPSAEGANNLAVALARAGGGAAARIAIAAALSRFPGYRDARLNQSLESPAHITTHPLRHGVSRREYAVQ
jgi:glycosyltransferase involved in cell wall biosynthesis